MAGNANLPEELPAQVQSVAKAEERSPDELVKEAVERYLQTKRLQNLYTYGDAQGQRSGIAEEDVPNVRI